MKRNKNYISLLFVLIAAVGCGNTPSSGLKQRIVTAISMNENSEFVVEYNDGKSMNLGMVETSDNSLSVDDGYWVVGGKKTTVKLGDDERFSETYFDTTENITPNETHTNGRYELQSTNQVTFIENSNYHSKKYIVKPGDRFVASFAVQADAVLGVMFLDESGKCIWSNFHKNNKLTYFEDVELTAPTNARYLIINSNNEVPSTCKRVVRKNIYRLGKGETNLKVGCFNCGQFDYADASNPLSGNQYAENWKSMIKNYNCDLFSFEDVINTNVANGSITDNNGFANGIKPNEVLGCNEGTSMVNLNGVASCLRVASKITPISKNIIPCDYKIQGSGKETARFYALRLTFYVQEKLVAFYGMHLVAEGHISETPVGNSLSQQLRQKQFATLIEDSKKFNESILVGDFNAQVGSEYDVFKNAGFSMVNNGSIGTLRQTLCADNIIVSNGISISDYEVIDDYKLNTDHLGLFANLSL